MGSLHLRPCAFLILAQALFVEDGVRSIRQSVQNGQFLCRLAQNASHLLVTSRADKRIERLLVHVVATARPIRPQLPLAGYVAAMRNAFGVILDDASIRRAAVEGVPETVVQAAIRQERSTRSRRGANVLTPAIERQHSQPIKRPIGWPRAPARKVCTDLGPMRENVRVAKGLTGARPCDGSRGRLPVPAHA